MKLTVTNECLLIGASPAIKDRLKQALTMKNPAYLEALKRGRWIGKLDRELFFYKPGLNGGLCFPRGFIRSALSIIDTSENPVIGCDKRRSLEFVDFDFMGNLRPYQVQALADILKKDFGVLEAATGSGKTVVALAAIAARKQPTLILVHNKELMNQWVDRISSFFRVVAGRIGNGKYEVKPITVGIVNTVQKHLNELLQYFGQIISDEVHRCPSKMLSETVQAFDCKYMLGLSATPYRRDGLTSLIHMYIGDLSHKIDLEKLRDIGAVLVPEIVFKKTKFFYEFRDDYAKMVNVLTQDMARNMKVIADIMAETDKNPKGTCLVVSDRIEHCEALAELLHKFKVQGIQLLTGQHKTSERKAAVENVNAGRVKVLVATLQLIGEGFDCAGLSSLFLTTPIKFSGRLIQVIGRILRPEDGKQPRVYDYQDPVGVLIASAIARKKTYREMGW